jgi:Mrp family chromosome partitioning ATPase/capsular polysaccharide biosynthesis protein
METGPQHLTLRDYLAPVLARRWMILAVVAVAAGAAYVYYAHRSTVYSASTKLYVAQQGNPLVGVGAGFTNDRTVADQAALVTTTEVASLVARRIHYTGSAAALAGSVTAQPEAGADFVTITAHATTPAGAARIANGFAAAFIRISTSQGHAAAAKAINQLRQQLRQVGNGAANSSNRVQIQSQIQQLQVASSSGVGNATQIDPARPPAASASRPAWEYAALAAVAALIGSVFLAYALQRLDPRLKTVDQAIEVYRRPVLATIIHDGGINAFTDQTPALASRSKESFRELRINLDLAAPDRRFKTILITSAGPGEGKSTVARNLALALSEAGRRVALVDADLRRPTLPGTLGLEPTAGLTDVLAGTRTLSEILRSVRIADAGMIGPMEIMVPRSESGDEFGDWDGNQITFMPAGTTPANPPAVMESAAFRSLLQHVAEHHDVVVIDSTPLTAVSDVIPLLAHVEAIVLVARSGTTDQRSARHAAEVMNRVPSANFVGVVVNGLPVAEATAYGAGYGYGYGYSADSSAPMPAAESRSAPAGDRRR